MDPNRFDGLVRSLAQPASRRRTLGVLVGALALLGEAAPALATHRQPAKRHHHGKGAQHPQSPQQGASVTKCAATKTSNSACAQWCVSTFGTNTPAASQCTSDAAKCQGLCYSACGPTADSPRNGYKRCGTQCVQLGTLQNCTDCGDACTTGQTCSFCASASCGAGAGKGCICAPNCSGKACGADNGCGVPCLTGSCTAPKTCGGGGTTGVCGCGASCAGKACGDPDGCGGTCQTGSCPSGQTCGGGGTSGVCGCTASCAGKCPGDRDGCGGSCFVGYSCPDGQTCGGGQCCSAAICGSDGCSQVCYPIPQ